MRSTIFILLLCTFSLIMAQTRPEENAVPYCGPDFAQGYYDQYSRNFINSDMNGRGNTGVSIGGGVESAFHNPATLLDDYSSLYIELMLKGNAEEFNERNDRRYQSPFPFSSLGFTIKPISNFHVGFSYNLVNSMEYYTFSRKLFATEEIIDYVPTYLNHQLNLTFNYKVLPNLSFGVNGIFNTQSFMNYRNEGKIDKLDFTESFMRIQPGFLYQTKYFNIGASYLNKTDVSYQHSYVNYEMTLPTEIKTGISIGNTEKLFFAFDTHYTKYSEQADYLDDQLIMKFGIERRFPNPILKVGEYSLKAGLIICPEIFNGAYEVPDFSSPTLDNFHAEFYKEIPKYGIIKKNNMALLTIGTSVRIKKDVSLNLAYMADISGDVRLSQFMSSLKFDTNVFSYLKK